MKSPLAWTRAEKDFFRTLSTPVRIQEFLDALQYRAEEKAASPRGVIEERRAHCFDGALFGAAALRQLGHPPRLLDLRAVRDDDHVLALFQVDRHWGAVAKSNFVGLRYREPIHRTLRELVVSYFNDYFNAAGERTLREYSSVLSLAQYDRVGWMFRAEPLPMISDRLDTIPHRPLLTREMVRRLTPVDERTKQGGMVGTLAEGLYKLA